MIQNRLPSLVSYTDSSRPPSTSARWFAKGAFGAGALDSSRSFREVG